MLRTRARRLAVVIGIALAVAACRKSPSETTATLGAPVLISPTTGTAFAPSAQPVTMVVSNVAGTSAAAVYRFELSADVSFGTVIATGTVTAGSGGQTSYRADTLAANSTYYWRARVQDGSNTGPYSTANAFSIAPILAISSPAPVSPQDGVNLNGWPAMTVSNAYCSAPTGALIYRFEIANSASFSTVVVSGTVPEGAGQTSFQPPTSPAPSIGVTYYWRVLVTDTASGTVSTPSPTRTFTYGSRAQGMAELQGLTLWPGTKPSNPPGLAKLGTGWELFTKASPLDGRLVTSPMLENLRILDLIDRGMDPASACSWVEQNYGPTSALYYPYIVEGVIGFSYNYMAKSNGQWDLVFRIGG
jgi:hypothetical protein